MVGDSSNRFFRYAAAQILVVAVLAGVAFWLAGMNAPHINVDIARSGVGGALTAWLLVALAVLSLLLYLAIPVAVGGYVATRSDRYWLSGVVWSGAALLGFPWLFFSFWMLAGKDGWDPSVGALVLVGGPALVVAAHRLAADRSPTNTSTRPPSETFLGLLLAVAVLAAFVGGYFLVAFDRSAAGLVERRITAFGPVAPTVSFDYDYRATGDDRGVLTITHDDGEALDAGNLSLRGSGFADVPGATHTEPGPWAAGSDGPVDTGDSVTVGVTGDCEIDVVWSSPEGRTIQAVGQYRCSERTDDEPTPEPTEFPGGP